MPPPASHAREPPRCPCRRRPAPPARWSRREGCRSSAWWCPAPSAPHPHAGSAPPWSRDAPRGCRPQPPLRSKAGGTQPPAMHGPERSPEAAFPDASPNTAPSPRSGAAPARRDGCPGRTRAPPSRHRRQDAAIPSAPQPAPAPHTVLPASPPAATSSTPGAPAPPRAGPAGSPMSRQHPPSPPHGTRSRHARGRHSCTPAPADHHAVLPSRPQPDPSPAPAHARQGPEPAPKAGAGSGGCSLSAPIPRNGLARSSQYIGPAPSGASSPRRSRSHPNTRTETISPDSSTLCRDAAEPPPDGTTPSSNGNAANPRDPRSVPATPSPEPPASSPHAGPDATAMHPPAAAALPPPEASTPAPTPASAGSSAPTKRTARPARCATSRERTTRSQARSGSRLPPGPRPQTTKAFPRKTVASQSACIMHATEPSPC